MGTAFQNRAPPQITTCVPQTALCSTKRGLCPQESNRLGAIRVQFDALDL